MYPCTMDGGLRSTGARVLPWLNCVQYRASRSIVLIYSGRIHPLQEFLASDIYNESECADDIHAHHSAVTGQIVVGPSPYIPAVDRS